MPQCASVENKTAKLVEDILSEYGVELWTINFLTYSVIKKGIINKYFFILLEFSLHHE